LLTVPALAQSNVAGEWMVTLHQLGSPRYLRMELKQEGEKLTGAAGGNTLEGTVRGNQVEFVLISGNDKRPHKGVLEGGVMKGETTTFQNRAARWTATRIPARPAAAKTHVFEPKEFHLFFTSAIPPVLRIHAGDTVRTWGVDAGGVDKDGQPRSGGGNPQTGPFYIEQAVPGDTLAVRINRVRTNRDWAVSGTTIMSNALEPGRLGGIKWEQGFPRRWKLDAAKGVAYLEKPTERLKDFTVPLRPMLGCVGVAPPESGSVRTTDSGRFGGNMDYNQIQEGTTVYLPVFHPGALLFLGDGHAAQGDGELTGDALETSMDFEFTVDVIPGWSQGHPLAENAEYRISIGIGGSLDQALQMATSGLMRWLARDYMLNPNELAMLLGFAVRYDVADLVGTQVSIAAKIPKSALAQIKN
jgi:acetamidase/formamidase